MFDLPLHPALVHIPLGLVLIVPFAALLLFRREPAWEPDRVLRFVPAALLAVVLASGLAAMRTGEADEELVEERVPEAAIERHEEAAELFVWLVGLGVVALGAAGAAAPGVRRRGLASLGLVLALASVGAGLRVGHLGGELVYRHGAAAAHVASGGDPGRGGGEADERRAGRAEEDEEEDD